MPFKHLSDLHSSTVTMLHIKASKLSEHSTNNVQQHAFSPPSQILTHQLQCTVTKTVNFLFSFTIVWLKFLALKYWI